MDKDYVEFEIVQDEMCDKPLADCVDCMECWKDRN